MTWLLDESELLLRAHGYSSMRLSRPECLAFEDDVLLGFALSYPSVSELIGSWSRDQDALLGRFSPALRGARDKSWNVYMCFLSEMGPRDADERFALELIEADLRNTRKMPRCSLKSPNDVISAFSALLPIMSRAVIGKDSFPDRLARQLEISVPARAAELFMSAADEGVVGQAIIESAR